MSRIFIATVPRDGAGEVFAPTGKRDGFETRRRGRFVYFRAKSLHGKRQRHKFGAVRLGTRKGKAVLWCTGTKAVLQYLRGLAANDPDFRLNRVVLGGNDHPTLAPVFKLTYSTLPQ